jgi:hypothetical protein
MLWSLYIPNLITRLVENFCALKFGTGGVQVPATEVKIKSNRTTLISDSGICVSRNGATDRVISDFFGAATHCISLV